MPLSPEDNLLGILNPLVLTLIVFPLALWLVPTRFQQWLLTQKKFTALVSTVNSENSRLVLRTRRKGGDTASAMAFTENSR